MVEPANTAALCRLSVIALVSAIALTGCGGDDEDTTVDGTQNEPPPVSGGPPTPTPNPGTPTPSPGAPLDANAAPTISGTPPSQVVHGSGYTFEPTAADPDGDVLTYEIANAPAWATFDSATGRLTGTPGEGDIGAYADIRISVTDGAAEVDLPPFEIRVEAVANGAATLSWTPPTERTDGSPLTNLSGFNVYWGQKVGEYPNKATVSLGTTTYLVENLTPGIWYFVTTAFDTDKLESRFSNVASKVIP